jgi:hypothetical protein
MIGSEGLVKWCRAQSTIADAHGFDDLYGRLNYWLGDHRTYCSVDQLIGLNSVGA